MGLQHYTQDMSRIPLKYQSNVLFYTKYTHPMLICRGTDARTDGRMHGRTDGRIENIYSIFRDKLLLLGEHVFRDKLLLLGENVLVLVQHTGKVNPFLNKYRPIALLSWKSPITQCNCSVTNLNY
jgi:hypothetical protein